MQWRNLLLLPEDQEVVFLAIWIAAVFIGLIIGIQKVRHRHIQNLIAISALCLLLLVGAELFYQERITVVGTGSSSVTLILPLSECPGTKDYWPGGSMRSMRTAEDIRSIRRQPACFASAMLADGLYLLISSTLITLLVALISGLALVLAREVEGLNTLQSLLDRFRK